ncbi:hypothetical protein BCV69DRAFT_130407 [Microstroma glucosiphilum]|uniref:Uncharacterized protein n=1 Tax=Pseudomicrostroma glucosiphilum TaxID=1684307 RepID=A0A316TY95_9BASI|nr:hypothetical protein BCV69DRAFT_130407 [Pseudomicrostroma glucosiphilum]PWN17704.1 hypothetical protein BCV69DRAFT_130407 [Pseudomicrostroma glucosiphilum]
MPAIRRRQAAHIANTRGRCASAPPATTLPEELSPLSMAPLPLSNTPTLHEGLHAAELHPHKVIRSQKLIHPKGPPHAPSTTTLASPVQMNPSHQVHVVETRTKAQLERDGDFTTPSPPPEPREFRSEHWHFIRLRTKRPDGRKDVPHSSDKKPATAIVYLQAQPGPHKACIGSGSSISLIEAGHLKKHIPNATIQRVNHAGFPVKGMGESSQIINQYVILDVGFVCGQTAIIIDVRFYLISGGPQKVLIGNDVLQDHHALIDYKYSCLSFQRSPEYKFPLEIYQQLPPALSTRQS